MSQPLLAGEIVIIVYATISVGKLSNFNMSSGIIKPLMVRSEGLEPPTPWFEAKYSIQLSYERNLVVLQKWWAV